MWASPNRAGATHSGSVIARGDRSTLAGKRLRCHCREDELCRGDSLIKKFLGGGEQKSKTGTIVEIICGHAGLSRAVSGRGFDVAAKGWSQNKHKPKVPIRRLDLTEEADQQKLFEFIRSGEVIAVAIAPLCGTSSRARRFLYPRSCFDKERRLQSPFERTHYPLGWPDLDQNNRRKVARANMLARVAAAAEPAFGLEIPFAIGNPRRSILWQHPAFIRLAKLASPYMEFTRQVDTPQGSLRFNRWQWYATALTRTSPGASSSPRSGTTRPRTSQSTKRACARLSRSSSSSTLGDQSLPKVRNKKQRRGNHKFSDGKQWQQPSGGKCEDTSRGSSLSGSPS